MQPTCSIEANPNPAAYGQPVTISWTSTNADHGTLNGEEVDPNGSKTITATIDGEDFHLDVYSLEGEMANAHVNVGVIYPPVQASINASALLVCPGTSVVIKWWTKNATQVTINGEDVAPSGEMTVIPSGYEHYELHAYGVDASMATASTTIEVYDGEGMVAVPPFPGSEWAEYTATFTPNTASLDGGEFSGGNGGDELGDFILPGVMTIEASSEEAAAEVTQYFPIFVPLAQVGQAAPPPAWNPAWANPNRPPWVGYISLAECTAILENSGEAFQASTPQLLQNSMTTPGWPAGYGWRRFSDAQPQGTPVTNPPPLNEAGLVGAQTDIAGVVSVARFAGQLMYRFGAWVTTPARAAVPPPVPPNIAAAPPPPPVVPPPTITRNIIRLPQGAQLPAMVPPNTTIIITSTDISAWQAFENHQNLAIWRAFFHPTSPVPPP